MPLHQGGIVQLANGDWWGFSMMDLKSIGRTTFLSPVTWHEAGAAASLAPGTVGQYWGLVRPQEGADEKTRRFVELGSQVIMSPADAVYLDMKFDADSPLGLTWANGVTSARRAYEWDPSAVVDGIADDDILGVEAPLDAAEGGRTESETRADRAAANGAP